MSSLSVIVLALTLSNGGTLQHSTPTTCYRAAAEFTLNIREMRRFWKVTTPITASTREPARTPTDVYRLAWRVHQQLRTLAMHRGIAVSVPPPAPLQYERAIPADVSELLNIIIATSRDIHNAAGIPWQPLVEPTLPGKTPPDVFRELTKAFALLETLQ